MKKKKPGKLGFKKRIKSDPKKRVKPYLVTRRDIMGVDKNGKPKIDYSVYWSFYRVNCKRRDGGAGAAIAK